MLYYKINYGILNVTQGLDRLELTILKMTEGKISEVI